MKNFYHHRRSSGLSVPHILGLTASPIMNSNLRSLQTIEQMLDSICRTPKEHRAELLQHAKRPTLLRMPYQAMPDKENLKRYVPLLKSLYQTYRDTDISTDPDVLWLKSLNTERAQRELETALNNRKTYSQEQMRALCRTSLEICYELGPWAAEFFVGRAIENFRGIVEEYISGFDTWKEKRNAYLLQILLRVRFDIVETVPPVGSLSSKVQILIDLLVQEHTYGFAGIVFAQRRATVAILAHILDVHPSTKDIFNVSSFVGTSQHRSHANSIVDLLDSRQQAETLDHFKNKRKNLIVATSVLEEGIDVSACHIVLCFDNPANLKSFVQRRGRARKKDSKIILFISSQDTLDKSSKWQELEEDMRRLYEDDMRKLKLLEEREVEEDDDFREFRVPSTG
jgi:ERCC4-related helicase